MKICIISARFYPQIVGSGTSAYMHAKGLQERGHEVTVITDSVVQGLLADTAVPFDMRYISGLEDFAVGRTGFKQVAEDLFAILSSLDFDILHVNNFMPMFLVSLLRPHFTQPVVFTFYNTPSKNQRAMGYFDTPELDLQLARNIIGQKQYDRLLVGSKCYQDFALQLGADPQTTEFEYLGIDHADFERNLSRAGDVHLNRYFDGRLRDDDFVVLLPGRVVPRKGMTEAIEALATVRKQHEVKLVLTGFALPFDALYGDQLRQRAEELELWDEAILRPTSVIPRADLAALYKRADIVIAPSYYEGLGITAIEALKAGRALITTDVPGLNEVAIHDRNALVIAAKDSDALAEAIIKLIDEPELRQRLEAAGPAASKKFDNEAFVVHAETMYQELRKS